MQPKPNHEVAGVHTVPVSEPSSAWMFGFDSAILGIEQVVDVDADAGIHAHQLEARSGSRSMRLYDGNLTAPRLSSLKNAEFAML